MATAGSDFDASAYAEALALVAALYRAMDASDAAGVSRCFTDDALWHRPDGTLSGTAEIEAMVRARAPERTTAHVVSNLALARNGDGWTAGYYLTVFAGRDGAGGFAAVLSCEDQLVGFENGLRIASKRSATLLRPSA